MDQENKKFFFKNKQYTTGYMGYIPFNK